MDKQAAELDGMRQEIADLRSELAIMRAEKKPTEVEPVDDAEPNSGRRSVLTRRGVLGGVAVGAVAAAAGLVYPRSMAWAANAPISSSGPDLTTRMTYEAELDTYGNVGPVDTGISWHRRHSQIKGGTSQILSMFYEADGPLPAFPWPLYIQLTSRSEGRGQGVGAYVRLLNEKANWGVAFHTDLYHASSDTSIGVNVELKRSDDPTKASWRSLHFDAPLPKQPIGRAVGVNIHNNNTSDSTVNGDQAVNIQGLANGGSWNTAVNIEDTNQGVDGVHIGGDWKHPLHIKGTGGSAITVDGQYDKGLELKNNDIHLSSGSKIYLDDDATVFLHYDKGRRRAELVGPTGVIHSFGAAS